MYVLDWALILVAIIYIGVPFLVSWFHLSEKHQNDPRFIHYVSYSTIAVLITPIILKSIGNSSLESFIGKEVYKFLELLSYVTLIGLGGLALVNKMLANTLGQGAIKRQLKELETSVIQEKQRVHTLEQVAVKTVIQSIEKSELTTVRELLTRINNEGGISKADIAHTEELAFQEAIDNSLLIFDASIEKYVVSPLGRIFLLNA